MSRPRPTVLTVLLLGLCALGSSPATAADDAAAKRFDRIAGLCKAWTAAKYVHPALAAGTVDWDGAFATAALAVDGSSPVAAYRDVAAAMLAAIGDPATTVPPPVEEHAGSDETGASSLPAPTAPTAEPPKVELIRPLADGILLLDLPGYGRAHGLRATSPELLAKLPAARAGLKGLVVDLRFGDGELSWVAGLTLTDTARFLVPHRAVAPGTRWRAYHGYPPQRGASSGGYWAGFVSKPGGTFEPDGAGGDWRLVFLVDEEAPLPDLGWALVGAGDARVVGTKALREGDQLAFGVPIGEGLTARVRGWEGLGRPLEVTVVTPPSGGNDPAMAEAVKLLGQVWDVPLPYTPPPIPLEERRDDPYAEPRLPDAGKRLLAGCRAWGVISYFYPYLGLIGDWDGAFRDSLPELFAAADEDAYARAVLRLLAHVADGHTRASEYPAVERLLGAAWPALRLDVVEGQAVVAAVDPSLQRVAVGDVVKSVDGEPMAARMQRLAPFVAAATEGNHRWRVARAAIGGARGTKAVVELEGAGGQADNGVRRVELERVVVSSSPWQPPRPPGKPWRRLQPRIGYTDLNYLQFGEVNEMLADLADTDALVLDMRGYPNGVFWILGAQLNVRRNRIAAAFRGIALDPWTFERRAEGGETGYFFEQPMGLPNGEPYRGKVVMLINERAQSQAEHTGLYVEQATDVTFVGSPTSGSNGDITDFPLPGGIWVRFTGHDVRHADGRQLQRVGLQPHVPATPTIRGLREGRDEVLEKAVEWLEEKLGAASAAVKKP